MMLGMVFMAFALVGMTVVLVDVSTEYDTPINATWEEDFREVRDELVGVTAQQANLSEQPDIESSDVDTSTSRSALSQISLVWKIPKLMGTVLWSMGENVAWLPDWTGMLVSIVLGLIIVFGIAAAIFRMSGGI